MRIRQYTYFAVFSSTVSAHEMSRRIGMAPDEVRCRGSRTSDPPRPVSHGWLVVCRGLGLTVDQQIGQVLARLHGRRRHIAALTRALRTEDPEGGWAVLQVVRYFDGEEEPGSPSDAGPTISGQHRLLGWALEPAALEFLVVTGASIDVDEYG